MIWLIWTDARDDNAWNFGVPHSHLPWCFTISEDCARELLGQIWSEVKTIVALGRIAHVELSVDRIASRTTTKATR